MSRMLNIGIGALLVVLVMGVSPDAGAACKSTTFIPKTKQLIVRNVRNGEWLGFIQSVHAGRPTVVTWYNGRPNGTYYVPVAFAFGNIQITLVQTWRYETWLGKVRLVQKIVPKLTACGLWRF